MNEKVDISASAIVKEEVYSIIQDSEDSIMLCGGKTALVLSIPSMQKT